MTSREILRARAGIERAKGIVDPGLSADLQGFSQSEDSTEFTKTVLYPE